MQVQGSSAHAIAIAQLMPLACIRDFINKTFSFHALLFHGKVFGTAIHSRMIDPPSAFISKIR